MIFPPIGFYVKCITQTVAALSIAHGPGAINLAPTSAVDCAATLPARLRRSQADDDGADIVETAAFERGAHQRFAGERRSRPVLLEDALDLLVPHHLPEAIRTKQQAILSLQRKREPIDFEILFAAQGAVDLIALWVCVNVVVGDLARRNETRDVRVIVRDLQQAVTLAIQIRAAVADIHYEGARVHNQGGSDGRTHVGTHFQAAPVNDMVSLLHAGRQYLDQQLVAHG